MLILTLGLILFFVPHLSRELGVRQRLLDAAPGRGAYLGLYSLVTLTGLGLIIWGKAVSSFIMVWQPLFELRYISHVLMLPSFMLVFAGNLPVSYTRKYLRNPMLLGVTLWGIAHLWSNGDLASMLLFGSFALWAGFKFIALGFEKGAITARPSLLWDVIAFFAGLVVYVVVSLFHGQLFGVGLAYV